jgi:hypothetical protein
VVAAASGGTKLSGAVPVQTALREGEKETDLLARCVRVDAGGSVGSARYVDLLGGAAGRAIVGVESASLSVLAADAVKRGALVGAAEEVGEACRLLAFCDRRCRLDGPERLHAGAYCRCPCKYQEQTARVPPGAWLFDSHPLPSFGTNCGVEAERNKTQNR